MAHWPVTRPHLYHPPLQYDGPPGSLEDTFCLSFCFEVERFGQRRVVELIPGGEGVPVTEDNRLE